MSATTNGEDDDDLRERPTLPGDEPHRRPTVPDGYPDAAREAASFANGAAGDEAAAREAASTPEDQRVTVPRARPSAATLAPVLPFSAAAPPAGSATTAVPVPVGLGKGHTTRVKSAAALFGEGYAASVARGDERAAQLPPVSTRGADASPPAPASARRVASGPTPPVGFGDGGRATVHAKGQPAPSAMRGSTPTPAGHVTSIVIKVSSSGGDGDASPLASPSRVAPAAGIGVLVGLAVALATVVMRQSLTAPASDTATAASLSSETAAAAPVGSAMVASPAPSAATTGAPSMSASASAAPVASAAPRASAVKPPTRPERADPFKGR